MLDGCVPWPEELAARYRAEGLWEGLTIFEMVERTAAKAPGKIAVVHDSGRISYADLIATSARLAAGFFALGLRPLVGVVVQLPNGLDFVFVYLALSRIGAIPVMALRAHRHAEIRHFIGASGAVAYVIADVIGSFDLPRHGGQDAGRVSGAAPRRRRGRAEPGQVALRPLLEARAAGAPSADEAAIPRPDPAEGATMLPLSPVGKFLERELREIVEARMAAGS